MLLTQARDRRVLGLVECLRLTHPRSPPQQPASISKRLWAIAKVYWLRAGAGGAAAQQELLTATRMAAAAESAPKAGGPGGHVSPFEPPGLKAAGPGGAVPSLGPLLAQLQSSGLTLTRQQLAAAQALIRSRQEEQLRKEAFVNAIWGMSAIGGPLFFQQEMDAICQVSLDFIYLVIARARMIMCAAKHLRRINQPKGQSGVQPLCCC